MKKLLVLMVVSVFATSMAFANEARTTTAKSDTVAVTKAKGKKKEKKAKKEAKHDEHAAESKPAEGEAAKPADAPPAEEHH